MPESKRKRRRTLTRSREQAPSPETTTINTTTNSSSDVSSSYSSSSSSWPDTDPTEKRWPKGSLLYRLDDEIWRAMGHHVDPIAFDERTRIIRPQVFIRHALDQIGLGWVGTNNTSHRIAFGGKNGKVANAKRLHERNGWKRNGEETCNDPTSMSMQGKEKCIPGPVQIKVDDHFMKDDDDVFHGSFDEIDKEKLQKVLDTYGVAVIRGAMSQHSIKECREQCQEYGKRQKLSNTAGNGKAGGNGNDEYSYYIDVKENLHINKLQDSIIDALMAGDGRSAIIKKCKKSILLRYTENSENWAHRDGVDWTYQATLILSEPSRDFTGGEFYVARNGRRTAIPTVASGDGGGGGTFTSDDDKFTHQGIVRNIVEFKNAGDLVIFEASAQTKYFHGMLKVKRGTNDICERLAIGLLQKK